MGGAFKGVGATASVPSRFSSKLPHAMLTFAHIPMMHRAD